MLLVMKSRVAKRIRNGTSPSKSAEGVRTRRMPPASPPARLTGANSLSHRCTAGILRRYPKTLLTMPGSRAMVLVAFATIEESPETMRAGNVTMVPPPAIEFIRPASAPAPSSMAARETSMFSRSALPHREVSQEGLFCLPALPTRAAALDDRAAARDAAGLPACCLRAAAPFR